MIKAAAKALASLSPTVKERPASLLPPIETIRSVSKAVAEAVAQQAIADGLAGVDSKQLLERLAQTIWEPAIARTSRGDTPHQNRRRRRSHEDRFAANIDGFKESICGCQESGR
jgi:Malic enzyme, NAD binding domain